MVKKLKYVDICEDLWSWILDAGIRPGGEQLPSENELSAKYGVSRQTVRKALEILQNESYIYAEYGRGTFCLKLMRHRRQSGNITVITTYLPDYIFPRVIGGSTGC